MKKTKNLFLLLSMILATAGCDLIAGASSVNSSNNTTSAASSGTTQAPTDNTTVPPITIPDAQIVSIAIKEGTLTKTTYFETDNIDFSGIVIIAHFDDDSAIEVPSSDFTISTPNLSILSTAQTITITFMGKTTTFQITINPSVITYYFSEYKAPSFLETFAANKGVTSEFMDKTKIYHIGDDNAFTLQPVVSLIKEVNDVPELEPITNYVPDYQIELHDGTAYNVISGSALDAYLTRTNNDLDFTPAAIGKKFRITQTAQAIHDPEGDCDPIILEAVIVDGYNITTANQLSVIDNMQPEAWNTIKTAHNLTGINPDGVVLHRSLSVLQENLPAEFFYDSTQDSTDTIFLHRWKSFYHRGVDEEDTFNFYGNYFSINFDNIPYCEKLDLDGRPNDFAEAPNSKAFKFDGGLGGDGSNIGGTVNINDVSLYGNGSRATGNTLEKSGSFILFWTTCQQYVNNSLLRAFHSMANVLGPVDNTKYDHDSTLLKLTKTKGADSYTQMFFIWDGRVETEDCEFKEGGGPIFYLADVAVYDGSAVLQDRTAYFYPSVKTTRTSVSAVLSGLEPWFITNNAGEIATQLKGVAYAVQTKTGANILKIEQQGNETVSFFDLPVIATPVKPFDDTYKITYKAEFDGGLFTGVDDAAISYLKATDLGQALLNGGAPIFTSHYNQQKVGGYFTLQPPNGAMDFYALPDYMGNPEGMFADTQYLNAIFPAATYLGAIAKIFPAS